MKEGDWEGMLSFGSNSNNTFFQVFCDKNNIFFLFIIFCLLCLFPTDSFSKENSNKLQVRLIEVKGLYSIDKEELLDLLDLNVGDTLNTEALKIGIKRAFLKGIFDDIIIEGNEDFSNIIVKVEEKKIIDKIDIYKNEFFSKRFIKKNLQINEGERLYLIKIKEGIDNLKKQMGKRGFTSPIITYSILPSKTNKCILIFEIIEGSPEIIQKIVFSSEPTDKLKSLIKFSEGDIFDETKLEKLQNDFLNYYKKQKHVGVFLKYIFKDGMLTIDFNIGINLEINLVGNESISNSTLMEAANFYEINEFNNDLIDEMRSRMLSIYRKSGYPFAEIVPIVSYSPNLIELNIFIYEGNRYQVRDIKFTGTSMQEERLKEILTLKIGGIFNVDNIDSDRETLTELYHSLGYTEAEVFEPDIKILDDTAEIEFFIYEGDQIIVDKISFLNNEFFSDDFLLDEITLKIGKPYNEIDISDSRRIILGIYNRAGFTKARVTSDSHFSNNNAKIVFKIDEGEITFFGKNVFIGNERTKSKVIKRELQHKTGEPLNYALALKEKQQIQRLGLFYDVDIKFSDYSIDNKRDVMYYLDEANHGAFELGVGYGEYEKYRIFMDLNYKNLWGMNKYASFKTELSSLEKRLIFIYTEPWFLDHKISLKSLILFEDRREKSLDTKEVLYKLRRNTISVGLEKTFNKNFKSDIYYDFSVVKTSDVKPDIILSREDLGTLIISGFRPGIIYDTRDNPFEPKEGMLAGLSFKIASGLFFSETDFAKVTFYGNKYLKISEKLVAAFSLRGGFAKGFGNTTELPIVERFFLGGRTTVRGYGQDTLGPKGSDGNPTGGNVFMMGNLELRAYSDKGLGVVGFIDGGNVWQKTNQIDISEVKFTAGIGIRYKTPAGPLRIDYGHKLNRDAGESKGELHFSIGHAF